MPGPASPPALSWSALRTTTSVRLLAAANRSAKLDRSVSDSARVPARKETPSSTASMVPTRRRLPVAMRSTSASQGLEPVEDAGRGRGFELVDEPAVGQEQGGVGVAGGDGVVGDH